MHLFNRLSYMSHPVFKSSLNGELRLFLTIRVRYYIIYTTWPKVMRLLAIHVSEWDQILIPTSTGNLPRRLEAVREDKLY